MILRKFDDIVYVIEDKKAMLAGTCYKQISSLKNVGKGYFYHGSWCNTYLAQAFKPTYTRACLVQQFCPIGEEVGL